MKDRMNPGLVTYSFTLDVDACKGYCEINNATGYFVDAFPIDCTPGEMYTSREGSFSIVFGYAGPYECIPCSITFLQNAYNKDSGGVVVTDYEIEVSGLERKGSIAHFEITATPRKRAVVNNHN